MGEDNQQKSRRSFLKNVSLASIFLATGQFKVLSAAEVFAARSNVKSRFAVASDAHFGQPGTPYESMTENIVQQMNQFHQKYPCNFSVINGDIIHNDPQFLPLAKQQFDYFQMPYFVTRGNHDMVTDTFWSSTWGMPLNHDMIVDNNVILLGDTSNIKGEYTSPDLNWLAAQLEKYKHKKQVFIFLHIPQVKWSKEGVDNPAFEMLVKRYPNIKAIFHGHEHDQDGVKMIGSIPCLYDSHIGGSWGLPYKGFRVVELMKDNSLVTYMMNPAVKQPVLNFPKEQSPVLG